MEIWQDYMANIKVSMINLILKAYRIDVKEDKIIEEKPKKSRDVTI